MTVRTYVMKALYWVYYRSRLNLLRPWLWRVYLAGRYALIGRHRRIRPFLILGTARTGSNYLVSMLNSAGISCGREVLGNPGLYFALQNTRYRDPRARAMRHLRHSVYTGSSTVCGAKVFLWQLDKYGIVLPDLEEALPGCRYIILYRSSLPDQYYSYLIALRANIWIYTARQRRSRDRQPLRFDLAKFDDFRREVLRSYEAYLSCESVRRSSVIVRYEDLDANPQDVFDRVIFPHLGVHERPVSARVRKTPRTDRESEIANYAEVRHLWEDPANRIHIDPGTLQLVSGR